MTHPGVNRGRMHNCFVIRPVRLYIFRMDTFKWQYQLNEPADAKTSIIALDQLELVFR